MAAYQAGDAVHLAGFGKGIVREARNRKRYLVEVKGRAMDVHESQLSAAPDQGARTPGRRSGEAPDPPGVADRRGRNIVTLDLHGHTVEQALEALDTCLNDALLAGASELHVIHGKSGGRVKAAVHRRLGEVASVRSFRVDAGNAGVTIVVV